MRNLSASDLDHAEWARAQPVFITRQWSGEQAPASRHAEARVIWTKEGLIVRFVCLQVEALIVNPTPQVDKKTPRLWDRDVCEIFLAPSQNLPTRYFEFQASPRGEWIDLSISFSAAGRETDFEFHSGMTAAAQVGEGQVVIAMRIPWSERLPRPQQGDLWRVNLFRCVGVGDERYLAWQPTFTAQPNFHVPEVFGWLEFNNDDGVRRSADL